MCILKYAIGKAIIVNNVLGLFNNVKPVAKRLADK